MERLIFNTHDIILLVTIYQSVLFTLLIAVIKYSRRHISDYFLIGFLLIQAAIPLHILINYGEAFRFIALDWSPNLYHVFEVAYWLEGPLLLWYTRAVVYKNYRLGKPDFKFVIPALLFLIYTFVTFYRMDTDNKVDLLTDYNTLESPLTVHMIGVIRESLRVFFSILCLVDIRHCQNQIRARYSNVDDIDMDWLYFLVIAFLLIRVWALFVALAIFVSAHFGFGIDFSTMGLIGNYTVFVLVSALIFFSLMRSSLFEGVEAKSHDSFGGSEKEDFDSALPARIQKYMQTEKPYLATILTLEQLANQLEMSPRLLSTVINRHFEQNFFEFVNHYRVEEAKMLLEDLSQKDKTMIEIMADSGFNSKATFNTFFKKLAGSTPSQYRASRLKRSV
ncbi:MAG: helix-turn-helix domain-containing protein [Acidiferrobacterales bacterium]|nr:helix-turn-helix domain-containing protein [Acidiferrobacterales bacterium]